MLRRWLRWQRVGRQYTALAVGSAVVATDAAEGLSGVASRCWQW